MKIDPRDEADRGPPTFEEAFCELFEQQFPSLFRYLNRLTGDADLADDLAQEVFVRLYQRGSLPDDSRGWRSSPSAIVECCCCDTRATVTGRSLTHSV